VLLACALTAGLVFTGSAVGVSKHRLDLYTTTVDAATAGELARDGYDIAAAEAVTAGVQLDLVLSPAERATLAREGVEVKLRRDKNGQSASQRATLQAANGYNVWRSWDEPGGIRDEMYRLAQENPQILKLEVLGHSVQGREILALKMTQGARGIADGKRPAVMYMSNIHAREWISVEVNRRLLNWFVERWRANDRNVRKWLQTREIWFVLSANPDGYQYTFDVERLWRKNLRDNNGDGEITNGDGVDLNRNYETKWGWDNEGSSNITASETYRGPSPASEPETVVSQEIIKRIGFEFLLTYHSYGPLLLYPYGWQVQTPSADDPLYVAYTGTDAEPAVPGFDPGVAADLYMTNGTTDDYSYSETGALSWTPELNEGCEGCGFVFPDDEGLVQAEFERNLPFALDLVRSAPDPDNPRSHLQNRVENFYLDMSEIDPEKTNNPMSDFTFDVSYGDPQPVRVLAKRSAGKVSLKYQINGGPVQTKPTSEWEGGDRWGDEGDFYYHVVEGVVTGTQAGDTVKVWFKGRNGSRSDSFEYTAVSETDNDVLVLAAEDYSGISPAQAAGPHYLSYYTDALAANGVGFDVYDVDANGRTAPSLLGVLSHYDAVVWYTGDDIITRDAGMIGGTASRLANDEMLSVRAFLNEGGRLLYTGKYAGLQYAFGYAFDLEGNRACGVDPEASCQALSDDFLQYYLGAYVFNAEAGVTETGDIYDVNGIDTPFAGTSWSINGADSADNQDVANSFITTSGILPPSEFPQFTSWAAARYDRPGGPFDPHTGDYYVYSQIADVSYKRLTRTIDVPAAGGELTFWTSYDTEADWDYLFVEARTAGGTDWTTLPDLNLHTSQDVGQSCLQANSGGWRTLHPFLDHYQTQVGADACNPTGTTGDWHASSGSAGGWQQWRVDLGEWAGGQVEISISYASDWATQGLGVFVDDIVTPTGAGSTSFEEDADPMDGWTQTGPPEGSAPNSNTWARTTAAGFPEAAVVASAPPDATYKTLYMGFGFEGVNGAVTRANVMGRAMDFLLEP
jgi:hypothetical protein